MRRARVCLASTAQMENDVRLFYREALSLVKFGFDVHLVIPSSRSGMREGVIIHPLPKTKSRLVRFMIMPALALFESLKTQARIYHFHDPELILVGFLMRWVLKKRVVFDMRESTARQILSRTYLPIWSRKPISKCYQLYERVFLTGQAIIAANDRTREEYKNAYLVRNFPEVDVPFMRETKKIKRNFNKHILVYVGNVSKNRGAFTYIDLVAELVNCGIDVHLIIIGHGFGSIHQQLREKIRLLGLEGRINLTGRLDYWEAMNHVRQGSIGLAILDPLPNYTFCLAGKIVEYMMCGVPVLCSRFPSWKPYVEGEKTGRMVNPDDFQEIVHVCKEMLSNPEELRKMGQRGMEAVEKKYNWNKEFQELLRCYGSLLSKNR